jgi:hypothetical protein
MILVGSIHWDTQLAFRIGWMGLVNFFEDAAEEPGNVDWCRGGTNETKSGPLTPCWLLFVSTDFLGYGYDWLVVQTMTDQQQRMHLNAALLRLINHKNAPQRTRSFASAVYFP